VRSFSGVSTQPSSNLNLVLALSGANSSEAVEQAERDGQALEVSKQRLPWDNKHREAYESLGFTFGDKIDDLWQSVTFPPGWSKRPTDHALYTDIVDEQGNRRGSYFYKAVFYDQSASMWPPLPRYQVTTDFEAVQRARAKGTNDYVAIVLDHKSGAELYRESVSLPDRERLARVQPRTP